MDPVISRIGSTSRAIEDAPESGVGKQGSSKFDKALERANGAFNENCSIAGTIEPISPAQQQALRIQLRHKLEQKPSTTPVELFRDDLKTHEARLTDVAKRVTALPKIGAFDTLRNHLSGLESQYRNTGKSIEAMTMTPNMGDLLHLQEDVYRMSQNLEIFSRLVDQASSGIKTIIQTQV